MLKVIVDLTPITTKPSGVGLYVANLVCCLYELQKTEEFKLGIFYQPTLKNWLRRDFNYPFLLGESSQLVKESNRSSFFFLCPLGYPTGS